MTVRHITTVFPNLAVTESTRIFSLSSDELSVINPAAAAGRSRGHRNRPA
jgi:hypothetical protein